MKKRLISLMLAGAMLTGVGAMAGCGGEVDYNQSDLKTNENLTATNMIVAVYKKKVELHRADIYTCYFYDGVAGSYSYGYSTNDRIHYKCGKKDDLTRMYFAYDFMPDESEYDVLCEECFADYIIK